MVYRAIYLVKPRFTYEVQGLRGLITWFQEVNRAFSPFSSVGTELSGKVRGRTLRLDSFRMALKPWLARRCHVRVERNST